MVALDYARQRLDAVCDEIRRLKESEFPNPHSEEALGILLERFSGKAQVLDRIAGKVENGEAVDAAAVAKTCAELLKDLWVHLPVLGFVLRSTNVRNAFEVHRPLLRLARSMFAPDAERGQRPIRLLLSSEWEYSPFVYTGVPCLRDFVLVGLPAPESANPLLVPVAGHELGHCLWISHWCEHYIEPQVIEEAQTAILQQEEKAKKLFPWLEKITEAALRQDVLAGAAYGKAKAWALKQAEETFCDFVGIYLFGLSYLQAFAYLTAPYSLRPRSPNYPALPDRARHMADAAVRYNLLWKEGLVRAEEYPELFGAQQEAELAEEERFQLSVANRVLTALVPTLMDLVQRIIPNGVARPSLGEMLRIRKAFDRVAPAEDVQCLADVLNAGWLAARDYPSLWPGNPQISSDRERLRVLKELILKTTEVFEFQKDTEGVDGDPEGR